MMDNSRPLHEPNPLPGKLEFLWVEDEGLLRDEGAVFGLAGDSTALQYKEAAIRAYFRRLAAESARRRQVLADQAAALDGSLKALLTQAHTAGDAPHAAEAPGALLARHLLGMAGALLACVGIAVFVHELLRPAFTAPLFVAVGVVAAGLFAAFLPVSNLFVGDGESRAGGVELWKVRLMEFGVPLAASVFVVAWAWERLGAVRGTASAALLFVVFAFAGRQFLSSVPGLGAAVRAFARERDARRVAREGAMRHARVHEQREATEAEVRRVLAELARVPSAEEWDAMCDAKVALFRSEYELATAPASSAAALGEPGVYATNGRS